MGHLAKLNLHQYRIMTLPYRYTDYFTQQFEELNRQDDFLHCWIEIQEEAEDFRTQTKIYEYRHPELGALHYEADVSAINSARGKLYRTTLHPLDDETTANLHRSA